MRIIYYILEAMYKEARVFINNISIEGLWIDYDSEEATLGIQRFVKEYIMNVDKVLLEIE